MMTSCYQQQLLNEEVNELQAWLPGGRPLQRLSAEQLWDSLLTLLVPAIDQRRGSSDQIFALKREQMATLADQDLAAVRAWLDEVNAVRGERRSLQKKLKMLREQEKAQPEKKKSLRAERNVLRQQLQSFNQENAAVQMMTTGKTPIKRQVQRQGPWKGLPGDWLRAVFLPIPAPAGHPLRAFGQGDHNSLDDAHRQANILQTLSMIGGDLDRFIDNQHTPLHQTMAQSMMTDDERMDQLYQQILVRRPSSGERLKIKEYLGDNPEAEAYADLAWSLLSSHEWLFIR